jgi:hypothetical protein
MKIKVGTHRVVIILNRFVIKVPRILDPLFFLRTCVKCINLWKFWGVYLNFLENKNVFTTGFWENWNEYHCWQDNFGKINYLVPTKISFLGLINIQERCNGNHITCQEVIRICNEIYSTMRKEFWKTYHHTLVNDRNYIREDGTTKIVDYGSLREFIKKRGKEFGEILKQIK